MKSTKYQKEWKRYVFYIRANLFVIPLLVLGYGLIMPEFNFIPQKWLIYYVFICWAILLFINWKLFFFKCPVCKEYFFTGKLKVNLLQSYCDNCQAEKYEGSTYERIGKRFGF